MERSNALAQVLETLAVPHDRIIYIHSSMDWMGCAGISLARP